MITVDGQKRSSLVVDPPDGKVPPMKQEARKRNAAFLAGAVAPDAAEGGTAGPPGAFDGPELRPLAERCLLGFNSTSGPPTLPNYFYNNMELVNVYTTFLVDGTLFYYLTVVPEADAQKLQQTFRQIGQSIRLTDASR